MQFAIMTLYRCLDTEPIRIDKQLKKELETRVKIKLIQIKVKFTNNISKIRVSKLYQLLILQNSSR